MRSKHVALKDVCTVDGVVSPDTTVSTHSKSVLHRSFTSIYARKVTECNAKGAQEKWHPNSSVRCSGNSTVADALTARVSAPAVGLWHASVPSERADDAPVGE